MSVRRATLVIMSTCASAFTCCAPRSALTIPQLPLSARLVPTSLKVAPRMMARPMNIDLCSHVIFWSLSTFLAHRVLPCMRSMIIAQPPTHLTRYLDQSHENFERLSVQCWAAHIWAQAVASLVAWRILLPSAEGSRRALGLATLLSTWGGGFLLASHALIDRDTFLEKLLYAIGTRIVRAASLVLGVGLAFPQYFALSFAVLFILCATDKITFSNAPGRLLALLSLVAVASARSLGAPYIVAYIGFCFVMPLLPSSRHDEGHSIVAATLGLPTSVLLCAP